MAIEPITVFFSYSHKDEALRDELATHLEILKWGGDITDWHDRKILPGDEWDGAIQDNLNAAQIILLLISSDFIASRYCRDIEITQAMERHNAGSACVIPVILRDCMWSSAPFGKLQALPKNAAPITDSQTWPTKDKAFKNVAEGIKKAAQEIRQKLKAAKQAKLSQYEATYQQAVQQKYPLSDAYQNKLNRLQTALELSDTDIAPIVTRLSAHYGEARQKLENYRQEVRLCLEEDGGEISALSRSMLDGYRGTFGLTPEEATAVEQEELQPYRVKEDAIAQKRHETEDNLSSEKGIDYSTLRALLKAGEWKDADRKTYEVMIRAVGKTSGDCFTDQELLNFPCTDLLTIDRLWVKYSQGHFGFSVQKEIYMQCGVTLDGTYPGDEVWVAVCVFLGWRRKQSWISYSEVIFSTSNSQRGHLPARPFCRPVFTTASVGAFGGGLPCVLLSHPDL